jgi:lipoprotein-anchoring transpeptidase ErfK/SrfK
MRPRLFHIHCLILLILSSSVPNALGEPSGPSIRANIAWQIALERVGFSPGIIDGSIGKKTELATREFQRVRGLPTTGKLDDATRLALSVHADNAVATYTVVSADLAQVGPVPTDWIEKSKLPKLKYESLDAALAERFHCSRGLLTRLNPGRKISELRPGDVIQVPNIDTSAAPRGEHIEINLAEKIVRVLDGQRRLVALFHCSIAKAKDKLPSGESKVVVVSQNPDYTFDPKMWPEVKNVDRKLTIPPGPRNPVGLCWIGLGVPGVGIHGSPAPEMIGKTGSHGCFRLTNWDALRLSSMVRVGTRVRFIS